MRLPPPNPADEHRPWVRRASPLARVAWLIAAVLIAYGGLAPWSGWRDLGLSPFAYLTAPFPRYVTRFDLVVNVIAFAPLGALGVLALHPRLRGWAAVLVSSAIAVLLSGTIEGLQTYLPRRVPSNVDLLTNSLGAVLGAAAVAPWSAALIDRGRLAQLRAQWFARDATVPLLALALWPLAQVFPAAMLFGNGEMRGTFAAIAGALGAPWPPLPRAAFGPAEFVLAEAIVVSAGLFSAGLAAVSLMNAAAPRWLLLALLAGAALLARGLAWGVQFGPEHAMGWLTPGAIGGLLLGGLALAVAATGPPRLLGAIAVVSLIMLVAAVNAVPENPFFADWIGAWRPGRLMHASALAQWVAVGWPYLMLAVLLFRALAVWRR